MQNLISINQTNQTVSARELHQFLEVKRDFTTWIKSKIDKYGFENDVDYSLTKIGERKAHNKTDYALTLNTAKEIAMVSGTKKGKVIRRYFIECERQLIAKQKFLSDLERQELATYRRDEEIRIIRKLLSQETKENKLKREVITQQYEQLENGQYQLIFNQ